MYQDIITSPNREKKKKEEEEKKKEEERKKNALMRRAGKGPPSGAMSPRSTNKQSPTKQRSNLASPVHLTLTVLVYIILCSL